MSHNKHNYIPKHNSQPLINSRAPEINNSYNVVLYNYNIIET
jgi:hypothetical protein